jgi:sugar (pentulose or hexulose) kinase
MLVAGVDSSTQSTKVVLCDAGDGTVVGRGSAPHPPGTEAGPARPEIRERHAALRDDTATWNERTGP